MSHRQLVSRCTSTLHSADDDELTVPGGVPGCKSAVDLEDEEDEPDLDDEDFDEDDLDDDVDEEDLLDDDDDDYDDDDEDIIFDDEDEADF